MEDLFIGEGAAARYLGLSRQRVHQLTEEGLGRKVSNHWVFTRAELEEYRAKEKKKGGRPKSLEEVTMQNRAPTLRAA